MTNLKSATIKNTTKGGIYLLTSLKIRGFRGITNCEIGGLKRVNVFVGRNNHGKSSILEALYLASSAFELEDPLGRDLDKVRYLLNRRSRRGLEWGRGKEILWYRYNTQTPISVEIRLGERKRLEINLADWHPHPLIEIPHTQRARTALKDYSARSKMVLRHICLLESLFIARDTASAIGKYELSQTMGRIMPYFSEIESYMKGMNIIDSNLIYQMERVERALWNKLLKERHDKLITGILRDGYEVEVEDLTYMPYGETYQLAVKLPTTTTRADDLGDGARYSMVWLMVAALARNTAVLIEEPENHQHPGGLAKSLEMLLELIGKNNVQLFATTHSIEFIKLVQAIAEEKKTELAIFFIEMDKKGKIEPRSVASRDFEYLAKMGLDVRFLDII